MFPVPLILAEGPKGLQTIPFQFLDTSELPLHHLLLVLFLQDDLAGGVLNLHSDQICFTKVKVLVQPLVQFTV